jgi:hypothetical protein
MSGYLRPDEMASESQIRKNQETDRTIKSGIKSVAKIGTGLAAGGISARILPFLSEYITPDLAIKGISKISPDLGNFLKTGMQKGLNVKDGLDFIKNNLGSNKEKNEPAKQSTNIIEQYSPELHSFISEEVKKGRSPIEAGALAQVHDKFKKIIKKLTEDHKTNFQSILSSIYGDGQIVSQPNNQQPENNQPQQQKPIGPRAQDLLNSVQKVQKYRGAS